MKIGDFLWIISTLHAVECLREAGLYCYVCQNCPTIEDYHNEYIQKCFFDVDDYDDIDMPTETVNLPEPEKTTGLSISIASTASSTKTTSAIFLTPFLNGSLNFTQTITTNFSSNLNSPTGSTFISNDNVNTAVNFSGFATPKIGSPSTESPIIHKSTFAEVDNSTNTTSEVTTPRTETTTVVEDKKKGQSGWPLFPWSDRHAVTSNETKDEATSPSNDSTPVVDNKKKEQTKPLFPWSGRNLDWSKLNKSIRFSALHEMAHREPSCYILRQNHGDYEMVNRGCGPVHLDKSLACKIVSKGLPYSDCEFCKTDYCNTAVSVMISKPFALVLMYICLWNVFINLM